MKSTLIVIILALVAFGAYYLISSDKNNTGIEKKKGVVPSTAFGDGAYNISPEASSIMWAGSKILVPGYTDRGVINVSSGVISVESNMPKTGQFTFDMTSISAKSTAKGSGESALTTHLKSADFFDVVKYPTANFVIGSLTSKDGRYEVNGNLTIKGRTNPITFLADISQLDENTISVKAETALDRTLWDVRYGSGKFFDNLGDNVIDDMFKVTFDLKLAK